MLVRTKCGWQENIIAHLLTHVLYQMVFAQWDLRYLDQWEQKWFFQIKKFYQLMECRFLMNVQDLETAVRQELNVVAVVWLDGEYGLIKWKQQIEFNGEHSNLKFDNLDLRTCKFNEYVGKQINSAKDFLPALKEAFQQKGPAIIGVPVDYSENMRLTEHLEKVSAII